MPLPDADAPAPAPRGRGLAGRPVLLRKVATFVSLSAVGLYLGAEQPWREVAPLAPVPAAEAPVAAAPVQREVPPGDADSAARAALSMVSGETAWQRWLAMPGVVSRGVGAVAAVAEGESPRGLLGFLAPSGEFSVVEREGHAFVAEASFARYDAVARVVASVDARALVRGYRGIAPLVEAAYSEMAPPGRSFEATLSRALTRVARAPVPVAPVRVVPVGVGWGFAEARLESRSAAEKHLMRLGPVNQRLVQGKALEILAALADSGPGPQSARE